MVVRNYNYEKNMISQIRDIYQIKYAVKSLLIVYPPVKHLSIILKIVIPILQISSWHDIATK